ncbi:PREDICTED: LON peptidase N-terminal domain and RING finger protein 1-like [Camelina sativa]|uniref:LON peptidase N-terminal domain and RING finger protein 1-like n=1 Tax=Camelina sativa TaxID=90675 RepID=A0ABM0ZCH5_CAMSA|nr:PREDICTED: LON peptidase N-terminal domain and RING finger protein 1-like [Camelina sativa]XP_010513808.1 PREDICTED: LON peptidase N-terminal domain and RING finger protein 1-like [Camelina sativa]XP_019083534.1 PREDICTED: LON peptidase N-terminal domain and RING finger protein 1-like [Camelina sativa]
MIQMDGGDRLRVTLLDRMSTTTVDTNQSSLTGLTLEAILMSDKNVTSPSPPQILPPTPLPLPPSRSNHSNRTLLDVMQREHRHDRHSRDKTAWKSLREKLRLKRNATTVWISANPIPNSDTSIPVRDNENRQLGFLLSSTGNVTTEEASSAEEGRVRLGAVLAEERALSAREEETFVEPARMSLMELLEENEEQMSFVSVEGEAEETVTVTAAERSCCVCMVRSKGAAFIPCGHTFCRLCSRELWVQRGNCPLCNTTILEVLDLF